MIRVIQIILWVGFISIAAQVTWHPVPDVPVTGQTYAVLLAAYYLSQRLAVATILLYICAGALGVPIFADGGAGLDALSGASAGYLLGFMPAVWLVSTYRTKSWQVWSLFTIGTAVILCCGFVWLAYIKSASIAWTYGVQPFLLGGLIKIAMGVLTVYVARIIARRKSEIRGQNS